MVARHEKSRMADFVTARLENSRRYDILEKASDHILVVQKPDISEKPKQVYVFLHNKKMPIHEYCHKVGENRQAGIFSSDIFYKDGTNFFVRLGGLAQFKGEDRSLKKYSEEERNRIVHARDLEKRVLDLTGTERKLACYQPQTERLVESLRIYKIGDVQLDYSHIGPGHQSYGFAREAISKDYFTVEEIKAITSGGIAFKKPSNYDNNLVIMPINTD